MKKNILLTALCMFSIVVFAQTKQLTILHTNDTHSQIMPFTLRLPIRCALDVQALNDA